MSPGDCKNARVVVEHVDSQLLNTNRKTVITKMGTYNFIFIFYTLYFNLTTGKDIQTRVQSGEHILSSQFG